MKRFALLLVILPILVFQSGCRSSASRCHCCSDHACQAPPAARWKEPEAARRTIGDEAPQWPEQGPVERSEEPDPWDLEFSRLDNLDQEV